MPEQTCLPSWPAQARGKTEDRHSGDLEGTASVGVRQPGTSSVQIDGASNDRSSFTDSGDIESAEG